MTLKYNSTHFSEINKTLRLHPAPKGNPDGYGYFDKIDVRYIRKLRTEHEDFPYTIFSGVKNHDGKGDIVVGCQSLAW